MSASLCYFGRSTFLTHLMLKTSCSIGKNCEEFPYSIHVTCLGAWLFVENHLPDMTIGRMRHLVDGVFNQM